MNIILVDDEKVAVNALKRRVDWKKYGISEVYIANSMRETQELFRKYRIDVMLSDVEMPQGDGLELFEWVKAYYPGVECIYITCHPEFEYMRKAMKLGSADYILKPIDYEELDEALTQTIQRLKRRRQVGAIPDQIVRKFAPQGQDEHQRDAVSEVKKYVHEHIQEDIYVSDIAGQVFLNEQYLMRLFKKSTGVSILEYITNERIRLAQELLLGTTYPINRVADSVGYGNYSYFAKLFKRYTGLTPLAYRQSGSVYDKEKE